MMEEKHSTFISFTLNGTHKVGKYTYIIHSLAGVTIGYTVIIFIILEHYNDSSLCMLKVHFHIWFKAIVSQLHGVQHIPL